MRSAVEAYVSDRDARDSRRKARAVRSDAGQRLRRRGLGQGRRGKQAAIAASPLADVALHALTEATLLEWRASFPTALKVTAKQCTINDLEAALNGAYAAHRAKLAPMLPAIIKYALKAEQVDDDEAAPLARENQILTDVQIAGLIRAAREIDAEQGWFLSGRAYEGLRRPAATKPVTRAYT